LKDLILVLAWRFLQGSA